MPNYKFISCCHEQRQGGGIGIYVNEKLDFKERSDIGINDDDICQSRFIELNVTDKIIIIGILYRPPNGNLHKFMEYLNKEVDLLDKTNKSIYLMGDFNINLLKIDTNQLTADFYQTLISYSLIPTITKPTRITHHTATLIDNIFTNDYNHNHSPGLLFTDITDHLPIFLITELSTQKIKNNKTTFRFINKTNLNEFNQAVLSCNWSPVLDESDPNISYNLFMDKFNQLYELYFPFKEHKTKSYKPRKPWIPTGLVKSIKTKHKLFLVYINHNSTENHNKYKIYRNKLNHLIKISKNKYFTQKLENARSDLKVTWKILKDLMKTTKRKSNYPNAFKYNNNMISDSALIAGQFNDYFTNIGPSLNLKLQDTNIDPMHYLGGNYVHSLFF